MKATHSVQTLCRKFAKAYPTEASLIRFFRKYTDDTSLPPLLKQFLKDNGLTFDELYQALRYPSDQKFEYLRRYSELMYTGHEGCKFFQELHEDIKAIRGPAVKLGRSLEAQCALGNK